MPDLAIDRRGFVGIVEISRPPHNYFNATLIQDIAKCYDRFAAEGVRAIVLCAAGKNFCAGADFSQPTGTTLGERGNEEHIYQQALRLFRCDIPVIAAVQGAAIGGGLGLALSADFRVASPESRFSANFSRLGIHPGFAISVTLPRVVGHQRAARLLYTGVRIGGAEAKEIGLVDILAESTAGIRDAALSFATEIATSAPIAVQSTRKTLRADLLPKLADAVQRELAEQEIHFATADFQEGVKATAERRPPVFSGS